MITKEQIAQGYDKIAEKIYVSDTFYNEVISIEKNWSGTILDAGCGQGPVLFALAKRNFQFSIFNFQKRKITRLVGIDFSEKLLEMARQKIPEAEIIKADIDNMPFAGDSFDFVVMVDVFQYLCQEHEAYKSENYSSSLLMVRPGLPQGSYHKGEVLDSARTISGFHTGCGFSHALKEIHRVLKPGGKLIVTVPNKNWLLFDSYIKKRKNIQPVEDHFFTFDEMAGLLKNLGFKIEDYRGADCFRYYAPYHKYEMWLAILFPFMHKKMKKIIFKAFKSDLRSPTL